MANSLLMPPSSSEPQNALALSQQAPSFFKSQTSWSLPYPLSLFSNSESQEKWQSYENILIACLRTGDNESAYLYLEELTDRFGETNERVIALRGLYAEATARTPQELDDVMANYEEILKEDPSVFTIRKRRAALLRSMGKTSEAVTALTNLLDTSPTDVETWAELADVYVELGLYEQAIFSLEEVLLFAPNAWNMQAKLGEVLYLSAVRAEGGDQLKTLSESMRRFCRSIELCDYYLRGYYGLKLSTTKLLDVLATSKKSQQAAADPVTGELATPSLAAVTKLNEVATSKLVEIVRRSASGEKDWDGYNAAEVIAARELIEKDVQKIQR
ncbi:related to kinetoplast-associated protein KAP [Ramularia collo-cygni]|uniref:ER membrane protein complex subunit 2 n=1 Tax=Ramularia collo-cygni TaxID=112498 RepID=A0A2D3UT19_9PEZI|nr:related to kinetoplast-associated protein KAP [Ramularia collo-cygni]CZT18048.1 related to kinetoplast-associated protein KAP [Ramularia collo-cygni]